MPAYNAAKTLRMTYAALPHDVVDLVILVDDGSRDQTKEIAKELNLELFVHNRNYGYGANQKTCYREALKAGADIIVMVHPDYQYDPYASSKHHQADPGWQSRCGVGLQAAWRQAHGRRNAVVEIYRQQILNRR
jgi:glycosyltransferase involved in cell wall biosynthesis